MFTIENVVAKNWTMGLFFIASYNTSHLNRLLIRNFTHTGSTADQAISMYPFGIDYASLAECSTSATYLLRFPSAYITDVLMDRCQASYIFGTYGTIPSGQSIHLHLGQNQTPNGIYVGMPMAVTGGFDTPNLNASALTPQTGDTIYNTYATTGAPVGLLHWNGSAWVVL